MDGELTKMYYKIGDVAEILNLPTSTLRYWEKEFTIIHPKRNAKGTRLYTPDDIEKIRMIHFLVKERGLKLDAAQQHIKSNPDGIDKRYLAIAQLREIRTELAQLLDTLNQIQ